MCSRSGVSSCLVYALWCLLSCSIGACKLFRTTCAEDDRSCLGGGLVRSGETCVRTGDCSTGMQCRDSRCAYAASTASGAKCVVTAECVAGYYCSSKLQCRPISSRPLAEGVACGSSADCSKGMVCDLNLSATLTTGPFAALSDVCRDHVALLENDDGCVLPMSCTVRGTQDFGSDCRDNNECLAGLYCALSPFAEDDQTTCLGGIELPMEPISFPAWTGADCPTDSAIPTAYFEVPDAAGADHDFYRLPFPNDIRRRSDTGAIELDDHPRPPAAVEPPVAARFLEDAAAQAGFSTNAIAFFRFSTAIAGGKNLSLASVRIVDITPSSPEYNTSPSIAWGPTEHDSHYICSHWLAIHRPLGAPLRPNTTYAAIVTRELRTKDDQEFERSPDFDAMLSSAKPAGGVLQKAWSAYTPLRAWLASADAAPESDELLNAAVFTTGDPQAVVTKLSAAVAADGTPKLQALTVCKAGVKSACEDASGRGACQAESRLFTEIHGKLSLPIFQRGTAPYEQPEDGGDLELGAQGSPRVVRHENVCFALALPKQAAPAEGFPLVLYAHPLGGVFNEALGAAGLASDLARAGVSAALLAIELPQHGSRRGASVRAPQDLFLNYQNPAAMRGNVLQGAADLLGLVALAGAGIGAERAAQGQPIAFDSRRLALFAHGQGATHAALALAVDDQIQSVVLAGLAGHFANTSVRRSKPWSSAALLPLLLVDVETDGKLPGSGVNPMLALMQRSLDSADPINYADRLVRISDDVGRNVFLVYGKDDQFAPESSQEAFARAANFRAVAPDLSTGTRFRTLDAPAKQNVSVGTQERTVALRTYDPQSDPVEPDAVQDGHYVVGSSQRARADVVRFLAAALAGEAPSIGSP